MRVCHIFLKQIVASKTEGKINPSIRGQGELVARGFCLLHSESNIPNVQK